jgi:F-type H+-transporting ATPase subunit delta
VRAQRATATRYAKALFESAERTGEVEAAGRELDAFHGVFTAAPELRRVLARPWIKPEERRAVASTVAGRAGAGQLVQNFIGLVAARNRIDHLSEIVDVYRDLVDQSRGRVRAQVRAAVALTDEEKRQLAARLERTVGKQVLIEETVDPGLLGGFIARVGSRVLDGSLDGQLERMRQRLARG